MSDPGVGAPGSWRSIATACSGSGRRCRPMRARSRRGRRRRCRPPRGPGGRGRSRRGRDDAGQPARLRPLAGDPAGAPRDDDARPHDHPARNRSAHLPGWPRWGLGVSSRRTATCRSPAGQATAGVPYVFSNQGCNRKKRRRHGRRAVVVPTVLVDRRGARDSLIGRAGGCGSCGAGRHARHHDVGVATTGPEPGLAAVCSRAGHCAIHAGPASENPSRRGWRRQRPRSRRRCARTVGAVRSLIEMSRSHPGDFRANFTSPEPRAAVETFSGDLLQPGLASWANLETLRERTRLPVVLKGILHPDDARHAFELGVDAIVVRNHGGRQVDRAIASTRW